MNLQQFNKTLDRFTSFIKARGGEVLTPSSEWEVMRFRAGEYRGIVYVNSRELITLYGAAVLAYEAFKNNSQWSALPRVKKESAPRRHRIKTLLLRDGGDCFLCGKTLEHDISIEHLVPLASRGPDHLANLALMHRQCNTKCGHLSLMEKIKLRDQYRGEK